MEKDLRTRLTDWLKNYGLLVAVMLAVTLVVFGMLRWFGAYVQPNPQRENEVWIPYDEGTYNYDLSDADFSGSTVMRLDLSLLYYPAQLLDPGTIDSVAPTQREPGNTNEEYATQRYVMQMPPGNQVYKIYFYHVRYATRAYINGAFAGQSGQPADNVDDVIIGRAPLVVYGTPDENGRMDVILQSASFLHWEDPAFLGELWVSRGDLIYELPIGEVGSGYLIVGALLGFVALLLGMFIAFPRQPANLYFALACFMMAVRAGVEGDAMTRCLPFMTPNMVYFLFHISVPLLTLLFTLYLDRVFPGMVPRWSIWFVGIVTAAFVVTCLLTEPVFFTSLRRWYQIITEAGMVLFAVRLVIKLRQPTPEQAVSLFGIILFFLAVAYDIARYLNWFGLLSFPADMTNAFMLVFVLTQMVALFLGNSRAMVQAREAERRVAAEKEAVERVNELKMAFLANVSHEMKTPLAVMSGYAQDGQKALQSAEEYAEVERSMRLISSEADRLALMVGQVLDVSKIDEGRMAFNMRPQAMVALAQNALNTYAPLLVKNRNSIVFEPAEELPEVVCDGDRIAQVLINLLANAAGHTLDGTITLRLEAAGEGVRITVADTGEGIPPEALPHLFERYRSGGKKARGGMETGTGLGLYICHYIVEAHGGEIAVESEVGKGTVVAFTLPARSEP
ncbi:sensor histidine kinase [Ruminococcaceae bacterium OttesenSCG-928-D13]|nr:sensor histidine kinase [Ruminococcaceae bacterium OttesenSCG-928-D13]